MKDIKQVYKRRELQYEKLLKKQNQTSNFISALRLITFLSGAAFTIYFYSIAYIYISLSLFIVFTVIFVILARRHSNLIHNKKCSDAIRNINKSSYERVEGKWKRFADSGIEFIDHEHNYSGDLDIFGEGSLFQMINTTRTYLGRLRLRDTLTNPSKNVEEISLRQEAIKELSKNIGWRQRLAAEGELADERLESIDELVSWGKERKPEYLKPYILIPLRIIPFITFFIVMIFLLTFTISYYYPLGALIFNAAILQINKKNRSSMLDVVYKYKKTIGSYDEMLALINKKKFHSSYLVKLKRNLITKDKHDAHQQIKRLEKITSYISDRRNLYHFIFNTLFLWDYQCVIALEQWKQESGEDLRLWLETLGEFESLCSLSLLHYDHQEWSMPQVKDCDPLIRAEKMGHPLLGESRVCNNLDIDAPKKILLITGSNMSGKSTLLRTSGINLVLAYAGAPVCAESFVCSIMNIYTCMRVSDNLEKSISSFYAEILRIKKLVRASNSEKVFFLLDEIFKGTNSIDRHSGAKMLINKLSGQNVIGLLSTHDLELGELEKENNAIRNYHFREYYRNNELQFDYLLRLGVSTTRNALYLMKMAGIVEET